MKYDVSRVRRKDRILDEKKAIALLKDGEYGVLSMVDGDSAYAVPVNFVFDGGCSVFIHCAPEGRKIECMRVNPRVSFCVVGAHEVLPQSFSTNYESIVAECRAHLDLDDSQRRKALEMLVGKYSADFKRQGAAFIEKNFYRTAVVRLEILCYSGKSRPGK